MLRLLFCYVLLPFVALILLCYAAIPLWVPSLATTLLKPYNGQQIELSVGYPSHKNWHIEQLNWTQNNATGTLAASLTDVALAYTWQSLRARQWPTLNIGEALSVLETNPTGLPLIPSTVLIPSLWLSEWPKFKIENFELYTTIEGQPFELSGQLRF